MKYELKSDLSVKTAKGGGNAKTLTLPDGTVMQGALDPDDSAVNSVMLKAEFPRAATNEYQRETGRNRTVVGNVVTFEPTVDYVSVEQARDIAKRKVKAKRDSTEVAGIEWSPDGGTTTYVVQTDRESQAKLTGAMVRGNEPGGPSEQGWRMRDNTMVTLSMNKFKEMALKVADHVDACYLNQATLEAVIEAAAQTGAEAIATIDLVDGALDTGWPAVAPPENT